MPGRPGRWLPSAGRDKATVPYPREVARARTHARGRRPPPGVGRCARSCVPVKQQQAGGCGSSGVGAPVGGGNGKANRRPDGTFSLGARAV
jgi:hypothetical protein